MEARIAWGQAVLLGALQGITEFLPISSSGHLVLAQAALKINEPAVLFDVLLHMGTLVAVLIVFGKDVWRITRAWFLALAGRAEGEDRVSARTGWLIILGTVPAAIVGAFFKDAIEEAFGAPRLTAYNLLITGCLLYVSGGKPRGSRKEGQMTWRDALWIGGLQAVAILPGISRAGSTIAAGLLAGLDREQAARFSFLLFVPAILGAFFLKLKTMKTVPEGVWGPMTLGTVVAAVVGIVALLWLLRIVRGGNIRYFAYYCWAAGALAIYLT